MKAMEVNKEPFVFKCTDARTGSPLWKYSYYNKEGINKHSGIYYTEEDAIKGMNGFTANHRSSSKEVDETRLN